MQTKKSLVALAVLGVVGTSAVAVPVLVSAQTTGSTVSSGQASLVDKLAEKFNLKEEDVQKVMDEQRETQRTAREAERQKRMSEELQKLVDDGKITAAQKTLIENKQKELQAKREAERTELEKWATDNGIDMSYMMGGRKGGGPGGAM